MLSVNRSPLPAHQHTRSSPVDRSSSARQTAGLSREQKTQNMMKYTSLSPHRQANAQANTSHWRRRRGLSSVKVWRVGLSISQRARARMNYQQARSRRLGLALVAWCISTPGNLEPLCEGCFDEAAPWLDSLSWPGVSCNQTAPTTVQNSLNCWFPRLSSGVSILARSPLFMTIPIPLVYHLWKSLSSHLHTLGITPFPLGLYRMFPYWRKKKIKHKKTWRYRISPFTFSSDHKKRSYMSGLSHPSQF